MTEKKLPRLVIRQRRPAQTYPAGPSHDPVTAGATREAATHEYLVRPARQDAAIVLGRDIDTDSPITVTTEQLCSGTYVLGVQGVGKSSLLEQVACQLMEQDESVIVFDPHGQLIDNVIRRMPGRKLKDTLHLNLRDLEYPFALNIFTCADPNNEEERRRTYSRVMQSFEKLWPETRSGVYFQKYLPQIVTLLIEHPQLTLKDVPKLLNDSIFRERYTRTLRNEGSRLFWEFSYDQLPPSQQRTQTQPLLTRVQDLLTEPVIERIICQPQSSINLRQLSEQRKNLLVRLPINEEGYTHSARTIGIMLMSLVYATTFSFADKPENELPGFTLIVDEFQNFATDDYAKLFSQGRKFRVKQFLAHQYRGQLSDTASSDNRDATLTAGTKVIFRVSEPDSRALGSLFVDLQQRREPVNLAIDILDKLERHPNAAVKEFASEYVWPLQAGARDRVGTRRRFTWGHGSERKEISFALWTQLMADSSMWRTLSSADEARHRAGSPREGRDYTLVPEYPTRDFGEGDVTFDPGYAQKALEALNELLYLTQKNGVNFDGIENPESSLTPEQYRHYQLHAQKAVALDGLVALMFRFDDYLDAATRCTTNAEYINLLVGIKEGRPPEVAASHQRLFLWRYRLREVIDALIRHPISQGLSGVSAADVAQSLQHLQLRHAYVRIGTAGHVMETQPLAPGVTRDEEQQRQLQLREQTRQTLCRHVASAATPREEAPATAPQPVRKDESVPTGAPLLRRSHPLP